MWTKKHLLFALCLCFCLSSSSSAQSTWDDFDATLTQLEAEISNLQQNLQTVEQALSASDSELQKAKQQSQEQLQALKKYQDLWKLSEASRTSLESDLRASYRLTTILLITQIMSLIGIGALIF